MPPPVHGASMMGKYIHDSKTINNIFNCHYINLTTAKDLEDIGKIGIRKLAQFIRLLHHIRNEVKIIKPQLVYITPNACGKAFYKDFIVIQLLKKMGCKIVVHYHNKGVSTYQNRIIDNKLYQHFFKRLHVILLSKSLYADVQKYVTIKQVLFCPNGIPTTTSVSNSLSKSNCPHLLFLSNLLVGKGVLTLLDACQILKEQGIVFQCDFVGDETTDINKQRFQEECIQRGIDDRVTFHGKKYGEEKLRFFQTADIFVFPTFYSNECFPLVLLEAMEQSLPCISTFEGGIPDIIEDGVTGFLVPSREVIPLVERIKQLIENDSLRQQMGKASKESFKNKYTIQCFEKNFKKCLEKCFEAK